MVLHIAHNVSMSNGQKCHSRTGSLPPSPGLNPLPPQAAVPIRNGGTKLAESPAQSSKHVATKRTLRQLSSTSIASQQPLDSVTQLQTTKDAQSGESALPKEDKARNQIPDRASLPELSTATAAAARPRLINEAMIILADGLGLNREEVGKIIAALGQQDIEAQEHFVGMYVFLRPAFENGNRDQAIKLIRELFQMKAGLV